MRRAWRLRALSPAWVDALSLGFKTGAGAGAGSLLIVLAARSPSAAVLLSGGALFGPVFGGFVVQRHLGASLRAAFQSASRCTLEHESTARPSSFSADARSRSRVWRRRGVTSLNRSRRGRARFSRR